MKNHFRYDVAAYELFPALQPELKQWCQADYEAELQIRILQEKEKQELQVYFYRIGYTLAYPLPLARLPDMMPKGIPHLAEYPWNVWLLWTLRERWDVLLAAWHYYEDEDAWLLFQQELAATYHWDTISGRSGLAELSTGHLASYLAYALQQPGWDEHYKARTAASAAKLLERGLLPYVRKVWPAGQAITLEQLHNIKLILLISTTHLCDALKLPVADELAAQTMQAFRVWADGVASKHYSEGIAYEGFWLETLLSWLTWSERLAALDSSLHASLIRFAHSSLHLALPGRLDLQAPLGDSEAEMGFWINVVMQVAKHTEDTAARWHAQHLPPARMPASAIMLRLQLQLLDEKAPVPSITPPLPLAYEHPQAMTLRTGWQEHDLLAAVSASRYPQHHLHLDSGHVVIGTAGRWWITDPGYQQYREGAERDFTLGPHAHNVPVIDGLSQSEYKARLVGFSNESVDIMLDQAYSLPDLRLTRSVRLSQGSQQGKRLIIVQDFIQNEGLERSICYTWLGGTYLSWSFAAGWGRLSDGRHTLWIGLFCQEQQLPVTAGQLQRHEGSRGSLSLIHNGELPTGQSRWNWAFCWQPAVEWTPPSIKTVLNSL
ncbi:heparinase II/III family protein [Paenibacillus sp. GCM10027626]|uniref:heparinase II/III domain-containing protein n=1 Tax=Paenibacillus sp. GCM10027626 TaxID=3273411 RepID=UPI003628F283